MCVEVTESSSCCIPLISEYQATIKLSSLSTGASTGAIPLISCSKNSFYVQFCSTYVHDIISQYMQVFFLPCVASYARTRKKAYMCMQGGGGGLRFDYFERAHFIDAP